MFGAGSLQGTGQLGRGHHWNVGTTSVWHQAGGERQHRAESAWLQRLCPSPCLLWVLGYSIPGLESGVAQRVLQDTLPCCALGCLAAPGPCFWVSALR